MREPLPALINRLWCLHWPGRTLEPAELPALRSAGVVLDTCLRQLAFGLAPRPAAGPADRGESHSGTAAYRLLLEVASGLKSAVPGETNVFGQFRSAAAMAALDLPPHDWRQLAPVIDALQADTRGLRARHLQGLAGSSYGSLVRAVLKPRPDARVLFIGTGALARSMLPLFRAFDVGVWNHRPAAPLANVGRWFAPDDAAAAGAWATDAVFTTPCDPAHDAAWHRHLDHPALRRVVHLGRRRESATCWPGKSASFSLDDVFALAGERAHQREQQLTAAREACGTLTAARCAVTAPVPRSARLALAGG